MTTMATGASRNRDLQDVAERHVFRAMEPVEGGGHIVHVNGTGTADDEAFYVNIGGVGIRPPKDANLEVHLLSAGSDSNLKFAIVAIPHDKEHKWKEGQGGIQKWDDPKRRIQWGDQRLHLTDKSIALGPNGEIELKDGKIYLRGAVEVSGQVTAKALRCASPIYSAGLAGPADPDVPGFSAE